MSLYEWARYTAKKGAVKMHTLLDHDSFLSEFVHITDSKCGDNRGAFSIPAQPHSVVVADRGYCDFSLLDNWDSRNVFFVVRHKDNLLCWLKHIAKYKWGLANLVVSLRLNTFTKIEFDKWLNELFTPPPEQAGEQ